MIRKSLYALCLVVLILTGLFFWYGTCFSLYVYSPSYLIKNESNFSSMMLSDLVNKTGSCKMRNYDSFLMHILKTDIREERVCDKCLDSLGRLANASLNKKYHQNIPFLTEEVHYFFLNFVEDVNHKDSNFLGIDSLDTKSRLPVQDYEYMNSLWKTIKSKDEANHSLNWHPNMTDADWKKYKDDSNNIPEKAVLLKYAQHFNERSIQKWENIIQSSKTKASQ